MEEKLNEDTSQIKYLKFKDIFAYSFGLFGFYLFVGLLNTYQAEFFGMLGADIAIVGVIVLVVKIVTVIFDPIVGNLIDKTDTKYGKLKPFIAITAIPLAILTVVMFIPGITPKDSFSKAGLYVYVTVVTFFWTLLMTLGDVPSQGIASVLTPNPTEKTNVISLSNTLKSVGLVACAGIMPFVCMIVPGGNPGFVGTGVVSGMEYFVTSIVISVLGGGLFLLIFFINKERVPYKAEKMSFKTMFETVKGNKPLLLVVVSCLLGFGRQIQAGMGIQAATAYTGNPSLVLVVGMSCGIGAMLGMAVMPVLIKKFDEKKTYIGVSIYGFVISTISYVVFFFNKELYTLLPLLFLLGFQFCIVNIMPMVMVADCIDYYEHKTGHRTEGASYAILTLVIKLTLAMGTALGLIVVGLSGYDPNVIESSAKTQETIHLAYAFLPGLFGLLSIFPIFKYDLVGEKKLTIARELEERRKSAAAPEVSEPEPEAV
ncbi:MAG: glycoside-pentoside-hexuronide (GPH):cation symporter [Christensenellaceae bacterium]|jgi:sugar (glycoside-pentoside-hexuronide) transporter|nr:glycoside-pentoside-hexuronide (GPH):cation symporter [Christensenellaceae bacterium]